MNDQNIPIDAFTCRRCQTRLVPPCVGHQPCAIELTLKCPLCNRPATSYGFSTPEGVALKTWHCEAHGDICPKRSHIANNPWGT